MQPQDIDLEPLSRALSALDEALEITARPPMPQLRQLMRDAAIQRFEFSFEMSWKALRRVLLALGHREVGASARGVLRMGRQEGLLDDVRAWLSYLEACNVTTRVYDDTRVELLLQTIEAFALAAKDLLQRLRAVCHESE